MQGKRFFITTLNKSVRDIFFVSYTLLKADEAADTVEVIM